MPAVGLLGFKLLLSYFKNAVLSWFQNFSTKNKINSMENYQVCFMSKERRIPWDSKEVLGQGELAESILLVDVHDNSFHHHNQTILSPLCFLGEHLLAQERKARQYQSCTQHSAVTCMVKFIEIPYSHSSAQQLEEPMFRG